MSNPLDSNGERPPIEDYALLGNGRATALVSSAGSIDWCCLGRFDERPVLSRLLDWKRGGHFSVRPACPHARERYYIPETNVLETRFTTDRGAVTVTDCLSVESTSSGAPAKLVRLVRCEGGPVPVRVELVPRFDYGLTIPRVHRLERTRYAIFGGADALVVETDRELRPAGDGHLEATIELDAGEHRYLVLTAVAPHRLHAPVHTFEQLARDVRATVRYWQRWASACVYSGPHRDFIVRSALVLKALTSAETGAIVAAATTSLPEASDGGGAWDYRYTWIRDARMVIEALSGLGYTAEATEFVRWLERTTAGRGRDLQVVYGAGGERLLPESIVPGIETLGGGPVRLGNQAACQFQLDVYGHVLDTVWAHYQHTGQVRQDLEPLIQEVVDTIRQRWREPDRGIWETRWKPRNFVFSKVMAWVALDRAIALARAFAMNVDLAQWQELRAAIKREVLERGVNPRSGAFRRSYEEPDPDAALLRIPAVGFLPPDSPHALATLHAVERELVHVDLVRRHRAPDHPSAQAGAFVISSFWRVGALARAGRRDEAERAFEHLLRLSNDVKLYAEKLDMQTGAHLGNFPQAYSHVGLIDAAMALWG